MFTIHYEKNNVAKQILAENEKLLKRELNDLIKNKEVKVINIRKFKEK